MTYIVPDIIAMTCVKKIRLGEVRQPQFEHSPGVTVSPSI